VICLVTAGPTYEPLDGARRITNFSTGHLGAELANFLTDRGHDVTLFFGAQSTYSGVRRALQVETFSTTSDLQKKLQAYSGTRVEAVFHAAAVSDFAFGKVWERTASGELIEMKAGKISTRQGTLLAELVPTVKIISHLRTWFPHAQITGWKYEVDGNRETVIEAAQKQTAENHTHLCVANGPAYGDGFGLVNRNGSSVHIDQRNLLFETLERSLH
jgi:phosphopantothenoylcysteine synthetase/decarboxylase